ncbi:MAG: class I SAM-dependent methyltransferase [Phyllobacteriaceae bacterium]|nr:class I SAM-dependent methyltransferase [Phyllobacteriaceae bacterium]
MAEVDLQNSEVCRLCGGVAKHIFYKKILRRYDVNFFKCSGCGSQQTEKAYWLDEAYSIPGLHIDVGAASRSVKNWLSASAFLDRLAIPRSALGVDFGSGPGLFASLMRNGGRDFRSYDSYTRPTFSSYFAVENVEGLNPEIITAFEVFEHLPEPRKTMDALLSMRAPLVIFTTWPVDGQGEDWIYYLPDCGQHIFFFSTDALRMIGRNHGYTMTICQYFYIYFDEGKLSQDQVAAIDDFSLNAVAIFKGAAFDTINRVVNGNEHIDADLATAMARFAGELGDG